MKFEDTVPMQDPNYSASSVAIAALCRPRKPPKQKPSLFTLRAARLALELWILSAVLPAMSTKNTLIYGVELAFQFANPVLLFVAPLTYLATWTNFAFIAQVSRMTPKQRGLHRQPNAIVVGVAVVVNILGVFGGFFLIDDLLKFPAVWVWLTSFVVLFVAVLSNEN